MVRILHGLEAKLVGRTDGLAAFDSSTGQPHRKPVPVVVTPRLADSLAGRGSSKLATPYQQGFLPQTGSLQIRDQGGNRLVCLVAVKLVI